MQFGEIFSYILPAYCHISSFLLILVLEIALEKKLDYLVILQAQYVLVFGWHIEHIPPTSQ